MSEALIFVRLTKPGFHCWPGAVGGRSYLGDRHRHLFHVEVACRVAHDDREIEFHDLRDEAAGILDRLGPGGEFGSQSCEAIARQIGEDLAGAHRRAFTVTVSEDGECGATVDVPAQEAQAA